MEGKMKHEGINKHRLSREMEERIFAEAWAEKAPTTLGYLLCGQDRSAHDYTQRDAEVAATIIQWLGSHVGTCFMEEVKNRILREKRAK